VSGVTIIPRPLKPFYSVLFLDALAIRMDGQKELLGLWAEQNEGYRFWSGVLNELRNRGVQDVLIAAVDGLTGFPEAINAAFPKTEVQLCMVHMVRNSLRFVPYKDRAIQGCSVKLTEKPSVNMSSAALPVPRKSNTILIRIR